MRQQLTKAKDTALRFSLGLWILAGGAFLIITIGWRLALLAAFVVPPMIVFWRYARKHRLGGFVGAAFSVGVFLGWLILLTTFGFLVSSFLKGEWQTVAWLKWDNRYLILLVLFTAVVAKSRKMKDPLSLFFLFLGMVFWSCLLLVSVAAVAGIVAALLS